MSELAKAKLIELTDDFKSVNKKGQEVEVQFNPESLKLSYANEIKQPDGKDNASGTGGRQFVGMGTTKLSLQLWFDVTAPQKNPVDDVRRLTQRVVYFMTPRQTASKKPAPPGVRFSWGTFEFDGMIEGIEETIEFFSPEGKPLRASITLNLSQQNILKQEFKENGIGQKPLTSAKSGDSLQSIAAKLGKGNWQSIAAANQIEDPLRLSPGRLIDLNAGVNQNIEVIFPK